MPILALLGELGSVCGGSDFEVLRGGTYQPCEAGLRKPFEGEYGRHRPSLKTLSLGTYGGFQVG